MKNASKLIAAALAIALLTGCSGGAAKPTETKDALLATETTTATEATKAATKATTPKPTTKPTTGKNNTGKTDTTKATEAPKPAENQKPAASEPAATQKPTEAPKPTNPPATEAPKPTNPPATEAPKPTNPPATEAPKPTDPPETDPPETEPEDPYPYSASDAMDYGNSHAASLGFNIDYSLNKYDDSYVMTNTVTVGTLSRNGGQEALNEFVIDKIHTTMDTLTASYGITDWSLARGLVLVEETTLYGDPAYEIYFLYG